MSPKISKYTKIPRGWGAHPQGCPWMGTMLRFTKTFKQNPLWIEGTMNITVYM